MTEEQRDSLLIEMSENIKTINNVLENHSKEFVKIHTVLDEHAKMLKEHSKELVNLRQDMAKVEDNLIERIDENSKEIIRLGENMTKMEHDLTERIDENSKEIVRLRENMARMEHELTDKIMALFDLGEVNKDKFEETDLRMNGIENTLDWHNRRLMKLEMAD